MFIPMSHVHVLGDGKGRCHMSYYHSLHYSLEIIFLIEPRTHHFWLYLLARKPQCSYCFCSLPQFNYRFMSGHPWCFTWVLGIHTQVLIFHIKHFSLSSHLHSPIFLILTHMFDFIIRAHVREFVVFPQEQIKQCEHAEKSKEETQLMVKRMTPFLMLRQQFSDDFS